MNFKTYLESHDNKELANTVLEAYELIEAVYQYDPSFNNEKTLKQLSYLQNLLQDFDSLVSVIDVVSGKMKKQPQKAEYLLNELKEYLMTDDEFKLQLDKVKQEKTIEILNSLITN